MAFINRHKVLWLAALFLAGCVGVVFAQPYYLNDQLKPDPYRKAGEVTCLACHQDESGGGLIGFGEAFQREGAAITPLLRTQFPNMFAYPITKVGDVGIHFSDPENKKIVIETGGRKIVVDVEKRTGQEAAALPADAK